MTTVKEVLDMLYPNVRIGNFYLLPNQSESAVRRQIMTEMGNYNLKDIDYHLTITQLDDDVMIKLSSNR